LAAGSEPIRTVKVRRKEPLADYEISCFQNLKIRIASGTLPTYKFLKTLGLFIVTCMNKLDSA
jgi:hypothetical protein